MAWLPSPAILWDLAKKVESLFAAEAKQAVALLAMQAQIDGLAERMNKLEAREEIVVAKAEGAARAASAIAATASVSDLSRRLGVIEGRNQQVKPEKSVAGPKTKRLPKP